MKKALSLLLTLSLLMTCSFALAMNDVVADAPADVPADAVAGAVVSQENFCVLETYYTEATYLARVENTSGEMMSLNNGGVDFLDAEGNVLFSSDYLLMEPSYLNPGESAFLFTHEEVPEDVDPSAVASASLRAEYNFGVSYYSVQRLACESELALDVVGQWWTEDYMCATVTNDTGEPAFGLEMVLVLTDAEGTPLYLTTNGLYTSMALTPGSSLLVQQDINSDFMDLLEEKGITPTAVEAIAYSTTYVND